MYTGTDRPALKYLNKFVKKYITSQWHDIGIDLLDVEDESELKTIRINNPGNALKCTTEMLDLWLEKKPDASWNQLIKTLRQPNIELEYLASKIEKLLSKGRVYVYCIYIVNNRLCSVNIIKVC